MELIYQGRMYALIACQL
jgi:hypothetical protein